MKLLGVKGGSMEPQEIIKEIKFYIVTNAALMFA